MIAKLCFCTQSVLFYQWIFTLFQSLPSGKTCWKRVLRCNLESLPFSHSFLNLKNTNKRIWIIIDESQQPFEPINNLFLRKFSSFYAELHIMWPEICSSIHVLCCHLKQFPFTPGQIWQHFTQVLWYLVCPLQILLVQGWLEIAIKNLLLFPVCPKLGKPTFNIFESFLRVLSDKMFRTFLGS